MFQTTNQSFLLLNFPFLLVESQLLSDFADFAAPRLLLAVRGHGAAQPLPEWRLGSASHGEVTHSYLLLSIDMIPTIITNGIFAILISRYYPFIVIVNYGVRIHYSWDNHSYKRIDTSHLTLVISSIKPSDPSAG